MRDLFVISHTHWDREWYRTAQQYRLLLLDVIDRLLDLMTGTPAFKHFLLDGQTVILEDYLQLRPDRADVVRRLVGEGRLHVGPWYVQPDEFLVSGEALIRNLLFGEQTGMKLGGVVRVGWLPDAFGHVAQLPQILRNFGIDNFVFSRGLGDQALTCPSVFWWEAPDGSRVLALHQVGGYWNAGNLGYPCFWGDTGGSAPDFERARQTLADLLPSLDPGGTLPALAVWNGADHTPAQRSLPAVIEYLDQHLDGYRVRHGSFLNYLGALSADACSFSTVRGELTECRYQSVLIATRSTRVYLHQANHRAQRLLQGYAEPLSGLAWACGGVYPATEMREAWRLLLQNHAHDSICGCSIDSVHREMSARFEQIQQIGHGLVARSVDSLSDRMDTAWCKSSGAGVVVFNPVARPRYEVAEVTLRLPERSAVLSACDSEGTVTTAQVLACEHERYDWVPQEASAREVGQNLALWREYLRDLHNLDIVRYEWQHMDGEVSLRLLLGERYLAAEQSLELLMTEVGRLPRDTLVRLETSSYSTTVAFEANTPALGYAIYALEARDVACPSSSRHVNRTRAIENEHVHVEVEQDGTLNVLLKSTGREFRGLHQFEDAGDSGDTYDFCPVPPSDEPDVLRCTPEVALIEDGPLQTALRIHWEFEIPEALRADRQARSARQVALPVTSVVRLRKGSPVVEISTTLMNNAGDHRLRVCFPTGIRSQLIHADGHMAVVSRPVKMPAGSDWVQPPSGLRPHSTWFATDDEPDGLAIVSEGLHEHEALESDAGVTLALTLVRAVGWLSRGDLSTRRGHAGPAIPTPEAQCPGRHTFRYGILPYPGAVSRSSLPQLAASFDMPLLAVVTGRHDGNLPPKQGFISLEPEALVLAALKRSETGGGLLMRFYNAGESRLDGQVRFAVVMAEVWQATAGEHPIRQIHLDSDGAGCHVDIAPHEIVTLLLCPAQAQS